MQLVRQEVIHDDHIGRVVRIGDEGIAVAVVARVREHVGRAAERRYLQLDLVGPLAEIRDLAFENRQARIQVDTVGLHPADGVGARISNQDVAVFALGGFVDQRAQFAVVKSLIGRSKFISIAPGNGTFGTHPPTDSQGAVPG